MQKNSITNKISPCCNLPFSVLYWWISNLTLNSESDRQFILSKISQNGTISIEGWKVLVNSGTLEADASLTKAEFLAWFDCERRPSCEQLKLIIEGFKVGNWTPETELPQNIGLIDVVVNGQNLKGNVYTKEQVNNLLTTSFGGDLVISDNPQPTSARWYFAKESGTYPNAGGLVVDLTNKLVILSYDGTTWSKSEVEMPSNVPEKVFNPLDDEKASTMQAVAKRYDPLRVALKSFLEEPTSVESLDKTFKITEVSTYGDVYGIGNKVGLLSANNTIDPYNSAGMYFNVWKDVPLIKPDKRISRIDVVILPPGNPVGQVNYVSIIGKKADGSLTILLYFNGSPATIQTESINVSQFTHISFAMIVSDADATTLTQQIKFYTKELSSTEDSVKNYIDTKIVGGNGNGDLDLIDFGCVGDGVTDDTTKINEAILYALNHNIPFVNGRDRKFKVSSVKIPDIGSSRWTKIGIRGWSSPTPRFGTIGSFDIMSPNGMEIISDLNDIGKGVINVESGSMYQGFNGVLLDIRNLSVRAYNNPQCHGINATNAVQLNVENVNVDTRVYNVQASLPTAITAGILTPRLANGAWSRLTNVVVSGFYSGAYIYEHVLGDYIILASNKIGLRFYKANHSSLFTRAGFYRNQKDVVVEGFHRFEIQQMAIELVGAGQFDSNNSWQQSIANLEDIGNNGHGKITYDTCLGDVGPVNTFVKNGGAGVICTQL